MFCASTYRNLLLSRLPCTHELPVVSDVKNAKLWAKKLWEFHVALAGPESQVTKRTQAMLDDPRGAPLFGTAKNATLAPPEL